MRIYKDKEGQLTIVWGPKEEPQPVTLVHDRGKNPGRNMWGNILARYVYHSASVFGSSGHYTATNHYGLKGKMGKPYKLVRAKTG